MYQAAYEMQYAAMNVIKAGTTFQEIVDQWPEPEHWGFKRKEEQ